jgi:transketolase
MRNHLIAELERIASEDSRVVVLTADLGYSVLDSFSEKFPDRCFNVGICEQNMTSVAAGLALEGHVVYTYSIGNFPVMRCLEQIRNCVCYHDANVKIIAVGGGFVYGQLGMSHHATEDLAITRALPNMRVFCPADPDEAVKVVRAVHGFDGPCYIRLARGGEPCLHPEVVEYDVKRLLALQEGRDVAVMATGPVLSEALAAARQLDNEGIRVGVYNCISLKPFDVDGLRSIAGRYRAIVSLEEHNVIGGLGGAIADALLSMTPPLIPRLVKLGLQDVYTSVVGSQSYLRKQYGLAVADIVRAVKGLLP